MPSSQAPPTVLEAERRSWSYWFVDGLPTLVAGLTCLLISSAFVLFVQYGHERSALWVTLVFLAFVLVVVVYARLPQTLGWLKSRITYPRTGYATPPYFTETSTAPADLVMLNLSGVSEKQTITPLLVAEDLRWRFWVVLAILVAEPLAGRFISSHALCATAGCAAGFLLWLVSRKDPRKAWAVVFALVFVQIYTLNFLGSPHMEGAVYFQAGVGFSLALTGAITLARYLRRNPVARA
ncbi:MAG: hypothetical protein WA020_06880 [Candidatus Acidiferrales bacterium]